MGTVVTVELPPGSSAADLAWIITIGPLSSQDWEPITCGPYERSHALALAQTVVADDALMAVVEPLMPSATTGDIRAEIMSARAAAEAEPPEHEAAELGHQARRVRPDRPPTADEVRAGWSRIAARLTTRP